MSGDSNSNGSSSMEIFTSLRYDPSTADSTNGPFYMLDYHRDRLQESATNFGFTNAVSRFEGTEGLDWLKESLNREVKSYQSSNSVDEATPLASCLLLWRGEVVAVVVARSQGDLVGLTIEQIRVTFTSTGYMRTDIKPVEKVRREVLYPNSFDIPGVSQDAGLIGTKPFQPSPLTGGALLASSSIRDPSSSAAEPTWCLTLDTQPTPNGPFSTYKTTERQHYDDARARVLPNSIQHYQQYRHHDAILYDESNNVTETGICSIYLHRDGRWVTPAVADANERTNFVGGNRGSTRRWALKQGFCEGAVVPKDSIRAGELCWVSNGVRGFNVAVVSGGGGLSSSNVSTALAMSPKSSAS